MMRAFGVNYRARVLTGLIGALTILAFVVAGPPWFDAAVIGVAALAGLEFQRMLRPDSRRGLLLVALLIAAAILGLRLGQPQIIAVAIGLGVLGGVVDALVTGGGWTFFRRFALYLMIGALYIGLSFGLVTGIRAGVGGLTWTVVLLMNNWCTDIFALVGGRLTGRRKLAPKISPSKTVEGAIFGISAGFTAGMIAALLGGLPLTLALAANALIAPAVVLGDLLESWAKRRFAVKDSGHILPGHGGFLDRMDGTLLAIPALALVLWLLR